MLVTALHVLLTAYFLGGVINLCNFWAESAAPAPKLGAGFLEAREQIGAIYRQRVCKGLTA
ncbi:MAG: hypothetical protein ACRBBK_06070 [Paracoccaceae bacterium]